MRALVALLFLLGQEAETLRITEAEFTRRRSALLERFPEGALVLEAGKLAEVGHDDNTPVYDFKYLTGFHDPDGILAFVDRKPVLFVSQPDKVSAGIETVLPVGQFEKWAAQNLDRQDKVYTKLRLKNEEILERAAPKAELVAARLSRELVKMRLVKSEAEIRLIRKASDATNQAQLAALRALRPGMNEKAIQDLILATFKKHGCPEIGFPPICAAGKNGTTLHYMENKANIPPDTTMVIDIGAAIENYVSDITRTLPTSGKFGEEHRKYYQLVLDAQKAAEAALKPGATFSDLERASRKVFTERGLTKWSYAFAADRKILHGLGHWVGMSVHDGDFPSYREKFRPGMVVTIEPGWYDKESGFGIRIEDIYLVTADGYERLSAAAPREIDEIEKLMREE